MTREDYVFSDEEIEAAERAYRLMVMYGEWKKSRREEVEA